MERQLYFSIVYTTWTNYFEISLRRLAFRTSFHLAGLTFMTGPVFSVFHFFLQYLCNAEKQENISEGNKLHALQPCFSRVLWLNCIAFFHICTTVTSLMRMSTEAEQQLKY